MNNKTKRQFIAFLKKFNQEKLKNFSGLGFILYDSKIFPEKYFSDLRLSIKCPESLCLDKQGAVGFFQETSDYTHPLHEGYHLFNENGQLTHVSQCFLPPIIEDIKPNESHGVRHLTAQHGSHVKGVIAIGVINANHKVYYFTRGKYYKL